MVLKLVIYLILLALVVLSARSLRKPGIAAALVWGMIAVESVAMQGNQFLLNNATFMNFLIAAVAGFAVISAILSGRLKGLQIPPQVWLYFALTGMCMLSYVWSQGPDETVRHLKKQLPYVITFGFIAPLCVFNEKQLKSAMNVLIYFGALVVLAIALSKVGNRGIILTTDGGGRAIEANPLAAASFAAYVGIAAMFSVWGRKISSPIPLLKIGIIFICLVAMIKSGSRGQLISFAVVCIGWLPVMAKAAVKRSTVLAMISAILVTGFTVWLIDQLGWGFRWKMDTLMADQQGRLDMAKYIIGINLDHGPGAWLFGLGSSSSFKFINTYPHNIYAETLAEEGLVGFAMLIGIVLLTFRDGLSMMASKNVSGETRVSVAILLALFSFNLLIGFKQGSLLTSSLSIFSIGLTIAWLGSKLLKSKPQQHFVPMQQRGLRQPSQGY